MSRSSTPAKSWLAYYRGLVGAWAKNNSRPFDAEDAAQESAANLLGKGQEAVLDHSAYLFRSTQNRLSNEIRRQSRHESVSLEDLSEDDHPLLIDPDAPLRASQLIQALEVALAQLPLKKRQVFIYQRLEGYTQAEIAQKMGLAVNTVERYVMDATRHIRKQLQDFDPE